MAYSSSSLDGPALRALAAGQPAFVPTQDASGEKARDRIWELSETLHCSIVGTCLGSADARALLAKLDVPGARGMSEHHLHGQVVHLAGRKDGGGRLLQKLLDRRHEAEIRRFSQAQGVAEVRDLWNAYRERGEIPGAYWAAITHPATDWALVQDIFGEVHMLSHLVGRSNRADIRRLNRLEQDLCAREETIAGQSERIARLTRERDDARARDEPAQSAPRVPEPAPAVALETLESLEARVARERAHAHALEERLAVLSLAAERLGASLAAETRRRAALEAELAALEASLDVPEGPEAERTLDGRVILYVGGRPRQVAALRRFAQGRGGRLLSHDGGIEESLSLLPGLVGQADLVLFPVTCVSHEAGAQVKRHCEALAIPFLPLRSASLASFVHAALPSPRDA